MKALTKTSFVLIAVLVIVIASRPLHSTRAAGVWYVATNGNDSNNCQTTLAPCASINGALSKSSFVAGDTLLIASGTYTGTGSEVVLVSQSVNLEGGWNETFSQQSGTTRIDGQLMRRGITVSGPEFGSTSVAIDRFTVMNGSAADGVGGGIGSFWSNVTVMNSAIINNWASNGGGGLYTSIGSITATNSTVSGNSSGVIDGPYYGMGRGGGGISNNGGTVWLNNVTVANNSARGNFAASGIDASLGTVYLQNSIVADNPDPDGSECSGTLQSLGYNAVDNASACALSSVSTDLTNVDPKIGLLQNDVTSGFVQPLLEGSPAINAGNPAGCPNGLGSTLSIDQRGLPRAGRCDIGAYEVQALDLSSISSSRSHAMSGEVLSYTIELVNTDAALSHSVIVTDVLPISLAYQSGSLSVGAGSYAYSGTTITWTGVLDADSRVSIVYGAIISPDLGFDADIVNSAILSSDGRLDARTSDVLINDQICSSTKYAQNPVLSVGPTGSWDSVYAFDPSVLKDNGVYHMWYTGSGNSPFRIGYATSVDGLNWTKYSANPVVVGLASWEANGVSAPSVISDTGMYKMWYVGSDTSGMRQIGYATSTDGIAWTKYISNPVLNPGSTLSWDDHGVSSPTVMKVGGLYHLWYVGYDGLTDRVGHATSSDGINWTKDQRNPVLGIGSPGAWDWLTVYGLSVIESSGKYLMWYSGETLPVAYQTGFAISSDGSTWVRQSSLIPEGSVGSFDSDSADYASTLLDGNLFKTWYSGLNSAGTYDIGYVTASICRAPAFTVTNRIFLPIVLKSYPQPTCQPYYADSFSDSNSGWPIGSDSSRTYSYTGGQYQILVKNANSSWSVTPGATATNFTASVSAQRASGLSGAYGIIFDISNLWDPFYEVLLDGNSYSIWRYDMGTWTALKNWTVSPYIATGTNWNRLKVVRNNSAISAYVNGYALTTVFDNFNTVAPSGIKRIGLVAQSGSSAVDSRFDDFAMYSASCSATAADIQVGSEDILPGVGTSWNQQTVTFPPVPKVESSHVQELNPKH